MTLLPDIEATNVACCGGDASSSSSSGSETDRPSYPAGQCKGVINCCTSAASSKMSIDETSSTASVNAKVNNLDYSEAVEHDNFSHCDPVDIEFSDVRYKVRKFSLAERKFGMYFMSESRNSSHE